LTCTPSSVAPEAVSILTVPELVVFLRDDRAELKRQHPGDGDQAVGVGDFSWLAHCRCRDIDLPELPSAPFFSTAAPVRSMMPSALLVTVPPVMVA
jgi:hypothetical protein